MFEKMHEGDSIGIDKEAVLVQACDPAIVYLMERSGKGCPAQIINFKGRTNYGSEEVDVQVVMTLPAAVDLIDEVARQLRLYTTDPGGSNVN